MLTQLVRTTQQGKEARPTFRPALETLESREVPANIQAQVSAAFHELPLAVTSLQQNINAGNTQNGMNNFNTITNDVNTLNSGAINFASSSRQAIDVTLFQAGVQLYQEGFQLFQTGDTVDANAVGNLGANAIIAGLFDYLSMGNGQSAGDLTLQ
jgi:hypothetical protein